MDINRPVENPALLDAMNQLRQGKGSEEVFFSELFQAKFLCPAQVEGKYGIPGKHKGSGGESFSHGVYRLAGAKKVVGREKPGDIGLNI